LKPTLAWRSPAPPKSRSRLIHSYFSGSTPAKLWFTYRQIPGQTEFGDPARQITKAALQRASLDLGYF